MRGLTPLERLLLARRAAGVEPRWVRQDGVAAAYNAMIACGRVTARLDDEARRRYITPTDLGLLALRVCPVGEP